MSFFNSIKRAFGFGDDDFEEEIGIDATVTPRHSVHSEPDRTNKSVSDEAAGQSTDDPAPQITETEVNVDEIFEHVLKVFNESLPPFLKESVDNDAQRKYLYDTLSESVKEHLENVRAGIAERLEITKQHEMAQLRQQLREAGEKARKTEESSGEWKRQQLSAERQKRAMAERIHDLENKINELQAEREQFELENKSLVNRMRVYSVQDEDVAALRERVATLQEQLKAAAAAPAPVEGTVLSDDEMKQLKVKQEIADSMLNELNRTAAELRCQLTAEQQHAAELTAQIEQGEKERALDAAKIVGYESEIKNLREQMNMLSDELQSVQSELSDANDNLSMMIEIQHQMEKLEDIIGKKNQRIKELQSENESLRKRGEILNDEILSLKKTIESNLLSQARSESEFRKIIDGLKDELARMPARNVEPSPQDNLDMPPIAVPQKSRRRQRRQPEPQVKISAIDDSLESTDWLVSTPPEGAPTIPGMFGDNDFGYHEPNHKNPPENDAQMSLW
ncbi:MAG: hypothetical protein K2O00_06060 [Muribaculaceae bacterium]|nr:hypothetical protein [Muribaculaceae bacterium]